MLAWQAVFISVVHFLRDSPVGDGAGAQPWGHRHEEQKLNKIQKLSRGRAEAAVRSEA